MGDHPQKKIEPNSENINGIHGKTILSVSERIKELEYRLALSEQMNRRYKQFIETENLDDRYEEYLDLFQEY